MLQADGGAHGSITGTYVARDAGQAAGRANPRSPLTARWPRCRWGIVQGTPLLDLEYVEDSSCDTDMNVVMTGAGSFVEVGHGRGQSFSRAEMDRMLALAEKGILELMQAQTESLAR